MVSIPSNDSREEGRPRRAAAVAVLLSLLGLAGCNEAPAKMPPPKPPVVMTAEPVIREVTDYEELVGQTAAVQTVEVRARVTGYLDKVNFKDGDEVKEGAVLFEIDPRPYEAEVARTEAAVGLSEAHYKRLEADLKRARSLVAREAISREEFDRIAGDFAEAGASVGIAKANRDLAKLNLAFTKVTAPISGRLSRRMVDPGNLVKADETVLTTIVSLDPMYVYFDVDERTLLRIRRLIAEGKIKSRTRGRGPRLRGPGRRGGVPAQGDDRLQREPGRPEHRDAPGPGRDRQPQAAGPLAGPVRARPPADRRPRTRRSSSPSRPWAPTRGGSSSTSSSPARTRTARTCRTWPNTAR